MVNHALRDFQQEGITGSLVAYIEGKTSGPRVEVRRSQGGNYQFVSICPPCQWAKLLQTKHRARKSLLQHLCTHQNGELRVMTQANRKNSGLAPERLEKSARKGRKFGRTRSNADPLGNWSNSSGACGDLVQPRKERTSDFRSLHKENGRQVKGAMQTTTLTRRAARAERRPS